MTRSPNHRRTVHAAAATGLVGALMAATFTSAYAMPGRADQPTPPAPAARAHGHDVGHGCFLTPHTWSEALAGPLPRCHTYVP